jgi:hypothetical protein
MSFSSNLISKGQMWVGPAMSDVAPQNEIRSIQANSFLTKLEELEAVLEQQKNDIRNYAPKYPLIGLNSAKITPHSRGIDPSLGIQINVDSADSEDVSAEGSESSTDIMEGLRDDLLDYSGEGNGQDMGDSPTTG